MLFRRHRCPSSSGATLDDVDIHADVDYQISDNCRVFYCLCLKAFRWTLMPSLLIPGVPQRVDSREALYLQTAGGLD